jgi:hypothetical protein
LANEIFSIASSLPEITSYISIRRASSAYSYLASKLAALIFAVSDIFYKKSASSSALEAYSLNFIARFASEVASSASYMAK